METIAHTTDDLVAAAKQVLQSLKKRDRQSALVVSLIGELGAGKTTFSKSVAKELGIEEDITSPTFVIEKIYTLHQQGAPFKRFVHIDAYRLDGAEDLRVLGWDRLVQEKENLIFVEWADKVNEAIPEGSPTIVFDIVDEHTRKLTWHE